jgi:chromosome segregation ATPase
MLTSDDARDLFSKTMSLKQSFVQVGLVQHHAQVQREEASGKQRHAAASKILALAKRQHNWMLAGLAVSVQLDAFTKVKEIMDKMVEELKKQQEEEVKKNEACKTEIDTNEDETLAKKHEIEDLESTISDLEGTLATLSEGLESAKQQVADSKVSLKRAGEDRKAANIEFQQVVADQRATINILNKALARLKSFYAKKEALLQLKGKRQEPGAAAPPPPPSGKAYQKSGGAGGVLQLIAQIIEEAERAETEAVTSENQYQQAYAEMVSNTNAALDALATEITEKTIAESEAKASKEVAEKDLMAAQAEKTGLEETGIALHKGCDYLLKNFKVRQTARQEEIEAIQEAKAILSGADFAL